MAHVCGCNRVIGTGACCGTCFNSGFYARYPVEESEPQVSRYEFDALAARVEALEKRTEKAADRIESLGNQLRAENRIIENCYMHAIAMDLRGKTK